MGREATCQAEWPGGAGEVKLRLETNALELRGGIRRDLARDAINGVRAEGGRLMLSVSGEAYVFDLGSSAERWAKAILTPPPSLAAKLGLTDGALAFTPHALADRALSDAVSAHVAATPADAALWIATVEDEAQLAAVVAEHDAGPLWIAHRKGKAARFGDNAVRAFMRAAGYIDSKSCAVSDDWSATRYGKR